jgi:4-phytase/acid phosphatase
MMHSFRNLVAGAIAAACLFVPGAAAWPRPTIAVERAVLVMRHGIRAPLADEIPAGTRTSAPWPLWPVAESRMTPHGARALAMAAHADRRLLAARGLLASDGCPAPGDIRIWTNSADRTIASGEAYASGLAPRCGLTVGHRPFGEADPLFEPLRAHATRFDAAAAIADIDRATGGMAALARRHRNAIALLDHILGCRPRGAGCVPAAAARLRPADDGSTIQLEGPIRATAGVAQVLLLQYVEGMPHPRVGWGRADAAALPRVGALHAALFAVFTRPPYMAAHQAALLGRHVLDTLSAPEGPRLEVLVGHDTNVTALAAALRVDLGAPGYATNDVPPGGALLVERLRDARSGRSFVRVSYRTQSPRQLRSLAPTVTIRPLRLPGCRGTLCDADRFSRLLRSRLAEPTDTTTAASLSVSGAGTIPSSSRFFR